MFESILPYLKYLGEWRRKKIRKGKSLQAKKGHKWLYSRTRARKGRKDNVRRRMRARGKA